MHTWFSKRGLATIRQSWIRSGSWKRGFFTNYFVRISPQNMVCLKSKIKRAMNLYNAFLSGFYHYYNYGTFLASFFLTFTTFEKIQFCSIFSTNMGNFLQQSEESLTAKATEKYKLFLIVLSQLRGKIRRQVDTLFLFENN